MAIHSSIHHSCHSSSCSRGQEATDVIWQRRSQSMTNSVCHISLQKTLHVSLNCSMKKRRVYTLFHLFQALKILEAAGRRLHCNRHSDRINVTRSHLKPRIKTAFGAF